MKNYYLQLILAFFAGWINRSQQDLIEYLKTESASYCVDDFYSFEAPPDGRTFVKYIDELQHLFEELAGENTSNGSFDYLVFFFDSVFSRFCSSKLVGHIGKEASTAESLVLDLGIIPTSNPPLYKKTLFQR